MLGNGGANHTATLKALVEAGADVNIADRQGATPLQHARRRGYVEMARILENAGATMRTAIKLRALALTGFPGVGVSGTGPEPAPGPDLAEQNRHRRRAGRAGWRVRHARPRARPAADAIARPAVHRRKSRRRGPCHRRGAGREVHAGRIHAAAHRRHGADPGALQEPALRSGKGSRADLRARSPSTRACWSIRRCRPATSPS